MFDFVVVGAGPAGLTAALYLALRGGTSVAIVEAAPDIGGCHRSMWAASGDGRALYYEHGPKVYSSTYYTLREIIGLINEVMGRHVLTWDEIFKPYRGGLSSALRRLYNSMSAADYAKFAAAAVLSHGGTSVAAAFAGLSPASQRVIDHLCRLSDGSSAATTRVDKFLSTVRLSETLYQIRRPLCFTLFKWWREALNKLGVSVMCGWRTQGLAREAGGGLSLDVEGRALQFGVGCREGRALRTRNVVFALPPQSLAMIAGLSIPVSADHSYIPYICATLHGYTGGAPPDMTPFGLITMELEAGHVLQCAISVMDVPGPVFGKTAPQCTDDELRVELLHQLGATGAAAIVVGPRPGEFPAYVDALVNVSVPYEMAQGVYTVGTHNLTSHMKFTTFESAAESAKIFVERLGKN